MWYLLLTQFTNLQVLLVCFFLQAASTPLNPLSFQCGFVKLRIDLLQAFSQLICTCNSLKTSPPPAIATTIAMTSGSDLQRCGRISNQACALICLLVIFFWVIVLRWEQWTLCQNKQQVASVQPTIVWWASFCKGFEPTVFPCISLMLVEALFRYNTVLHKANVI